MASSRASARAIAAPRTPSTSARLKGVGRVYQQTFIDTYAKVGFAKLYDRKTPLTAADLLNDRVIPFFDEHGIVAAADADRPRHRVLRHATTATSTSSTSPSRTSTTPAPRRRARRPTASASASTRRCSTSSTASPSARRSTTRSTSCRPTSTPGSPSTTRCAPTRADSASARRRCRPSLTPRPPPGKSRSASRPSPPHRPDRQRPVPTDRQIKYKLLHLMRARRSVVEPARRAEHPTGPVAGCSRPIPRRTRPVLEHRHTARDRNAGKCFVGPVIAPSARELERQAGSARFRQPAPRQAGRNTARCARDPLRGTPGGSQSSSALAERDVGLALDRDRPPAAAGSTMLASASRSAR